MSNAIYFVSFKLKKSASEQDFLFAARQLNNGYMSKQKGFISWKQAFDGETWADIITFETMDDAIRVAEPKGTNELADKFYSYINLNSCKSHLFSVEKSY